MLDDVNIYRCETTSVLCASRVLSSVLHSVTFCFLQFLAATEMEHNDNPFSSKKELSSELNERKWLTSHIW